MAPPPPPPPPPPMHFPFPPKPKFRRTDSEKLETTLTNSNNRSQYSEGRHSDRLVRSRSRSTTPTLPGPEKLEFESDSEHYSVPAFPNNEFSRSSPSGRKRTDSKRSTKWGYGWGIGKAKERERDLAERSTSVSPQRSSPKYDSPIPTSSRSSGSERPAFLPNNSLVGSALERKSEVKERVNTSDRLEQVRKLMAKDNLDYYIIPTEDPHQSEHVAASDKRREWICGFTGSAGQAIVSKTQAYLVTDSRYWSQAREELDSNWYVIPVGTAEVPKDWIEWLADRAQDAKIGIDARMVSHEKATHLIAKLNTKGSKLVFPPQNFVDLCWKDKPQRSKDPVFVQSPDFTGREASTKLSEAQQWIRAQPPVVSTYWLPPTAAKMHVGTLIASLSRIAYLLNLRGSDIPFNPLFYSYLFISFDKVILFLDAIKLTDNIHEYLHSLRVERREYNDIWPFLRSREWGEGKLLLCPETSYSISLMLTHFRYTIVPSHVDFLSQDFVNNGMTKEQQAVIEREGKNKQPVLTSSMSAPSSWAAQPLPLPRPPTLYYHASQGRTPPHDSEEDSSEDELDGKNWRTDHYERRILNIEESLRRREEAINKREGELAKRAEELKREDEARKMRAEEQEREEARRPGKKGRRQGDEQAEGTVPSQSNPSHSVVSRVPYSFNPLSHLSQRSSIVSTGTSVKVPSILSIALTDPLEALLCNNADGNTNLQRTSIYSADELGNMDWRDGRYIEQRIQTIEGWLRKREEELMRMAEDLAKEAQDLKREREVRKRNEPKERDGDDEAGEREVELRRREEEINRKAREVALRDEEAKRREQELERKELEVAKKVRNAQNKEEGMIIEVRRRQEMVQWKEEELRKREEELKRKEDAFETKPVDTGRSETRPSSSSIPHAPGASSISRARYGTRDPYPPR